MTFSKTSATYSFKDTINIDSDKPCSSNENSSDSKIKLAYYYFSEKNMSKHLTYMKNLQNSLEATILLPILSCAKKN